MLAWVGPAQAAEPLLQFVPIHQSLPPINSPVALLPRGPGIRSQGLLGRLDRAADGRHAAQLVDQLEKGPLFGADDTASGLDLQGNDWGRVAGIGRDGLFCDSLPCFG